MAALAATVRFFGLNPQGQEDEPPHKCKESRVVEALLASAAFSLNLMAVIWGSTALSDMLLTVMMSGCLLAFFIGYALGDAGSPFGKDFFFIVSALFMGLAVLTKGPVGAVIPGAVCLLFLLYTGELLQVLREVPWIRGALTVLAVTLPWYLTMARRHGAIYLQTFFGYHNLERFTKGVNHHHGRPFWYGLAVVLLGYLPWSLAILASLVRTLLTTKRMMWCRVPRRRHLVLFSTVWFAVAFGFFGVSASQLPSYYLPLAPAGAMLAAAHMSRVRPGRPAGGFRGSRVFCWDKVTSFGTYLVLAAVLLCLPSVLQQSGDIVAARIASNVVARHLYLVGATITALAALTSLATGDSVSSLSLVSPGFGPDEATAFKQASGRIEHCGRMPIWVVHIMASTLLLWCFVTPTIGVVDRVRQQPLRELATTASTLQRSGEPLVMVGTRMPSVVFYSKLPVAFFDTAEEAAEVLQSEASPSASSALILAEKELFVEGLSAAQPLQDEGDYRLARFAINRRPE